MNPNTPIFFVRSTKNIYFGVPQNISSLCVPIDEKD